MAADNAEGFGEVGLEIMERIWGTLVSGQELRRVRVAGFMAIGKTEGKIRKVGKVRMMGPEVFPTKIVCKGSNISNQGEVTEIQLGGKGKIF